MSKPRSTEINLASVEPRFGTREDLPEVVGVVHNNGIYVILDMILNHTVNVFSYNCDRYWTKNDRGDWFLDPRWDNKSFQIKGWNDKKGKPIIPFVKADPQNPPDENEAVLPFELQDLTVFTHKGRIDNWDYDPEFREGDFCDLKGIDRDRVLKGNHKNRFCADLHASKVVLMS